MTFSIIKLIQDSIRVIRKEKLIIAPFLLLTIVAQISQNIAPSLFEHKLSFKLLTILVFLLGWLIELVFKSATVALTQDQLPELKLECNWLIRASQTLPRLFLATIILMIPVGLLMGLVIPGQENASPLVVTGMILAFIVIIISMMVLTIVPIIMLAQPQLGILTTLKESALFTKRFFKECILLLSLSFSLLFISHFLSFAFAEIPILGNSVVPVLFKGVGYGFIYVMDTVFFHTLSQTKLTIR